MIIKNIFTTILCVILSFGGVLSSAQAKEKQQNLLMNASEAQKHDKSNNQRVMAKNEIIKQNKDVDSNQKNSETAQTLKNINDYTENALSNRMLLIANFVNIIFSSILLIATAVLIYE